MILISLFLRWYQQLSSRWSGWETIAITKEENVILNEFLDYYESGYFEKVKILDDTELLGYHFLGTWKSTNFMTLQKKITKKNYSVYYSKKPNSSSLEELWFALTGWVLLEADYSEETVLQKVLEIVWPIFLLFLLFIVLAKFMMPKWGAMPFNMKIWKQVNKTLVKTKFEDVAGMEEVKMELSEIVDYLKNPEKYNKVGARHPRWVLLYGQPWSGKTLLARAVAGESNVPFFSASGSEFMEMLVGMGAAKVRDLFNKAKATWKAIIFIDEIDAIGKKRWAWHTWWHQEQEQTLNQILTEMDGFDKNINIVVLAATNRPDTLDPALLRAGRFDRKVMVSSPTYEERILIFNYYFKGKQLDKNIKIESLAKRTSWLVGADIENIVNEWALKVAKDDRSVLTSEDLEYALEKVLMWPEKKVKSISEEEKNIIAFHELWHAFALHLLPNTDPVEKISIVRRWHALWATWTIPKEDKYLNSKAKFLDELVGLLGGRAAEEVFFGKDAITTWASNDFEKATLIVTDLLVKYGMDEELWPILYYDNDREWFSPYKPYSEKTAELIDSKIKLYIFDAYKNAKKLIENNRDKIKAMAEVLLEQEYLTKDEFLILMDDISNAEKMISNSKKLKKKLAMKAMKDSKKKLSEKKKKKPESFVKQWPDSKIKSILDKFLG